jgi:DNA-3-methyladenine glycosylase
VARTPEGLTAARERLSRAADRRLASGPGLVAAAFGVDTSWTGTDMCDPTSPLRLERDRADPADAILDDLVDTSTRVGVAYAGPEWSARPWRFTVAGHPSVSGSRAR